MNGKRIYISTLCIKFQDYEWLKTCLDDFHDFPVGLEHATWWGLQPELPEFLEKLRRLGYAVKLDTNGTNPDMLEALAQEGLLDYAAMDIKNSPDRYAETCGGVDLLGPVKRSAALLMAGAVDYEFRTTVCAPLHTPEEMAGIGRWLKGAKRYFLQPFVDSGELVGSGMKPLTKEEIEALRDSVLPDIPSTQIRGQ